MERRRLAVGLGFAAISLGIGMLLDDAVWSWLCGFLGATAGMIAMDLAFPSDSEGG